MKRNRIAPPDVFESHRRASEILAASGTRLILIEAIVILAVAAASHMVIIETAEILAAAAIATGRDWIQTLVYALCTLLLSMLCIFVNLPLFIGFFRLVNEIVQTGEGKLTTLFSSFQSARLYRRSLRLSWGLFVWAILLVCSVGMLIGLFPKELLAALLCGLLAVGITALFLVPMMRAFPTLALAQDATLPMRAVRKRMCRMRTRTSISGWRFFLSWLPQILLGLLTFGILLIWDTLPRMAISYFVQIQKTNEMIIRSEEHKEHE